MWFFLCAANLVKDLMNTTEADASGCFNAIRLDGEINRTKVTATVVMKQSFNATESAVIGRTLADHASVYGIDALSTFDTVKQLLKG